MPVPVGLAQWSLYRDIHSNLIEMLLSDFSKLKNPPVPTHRGMETSKFKEISLHFKVRSLIPLQRDWIPAAVYLALDAGPE